MQYVTGIRPEIFEWQQVEAPALGDVGVAVNGTVWGVALHDTSGNDEGTVHRWDGRRWHEQPVTARHVEAAPRGEAWLVDAGGVLHEPVDGGWAPVETPGPVLDVSIGLDGGVWVVTKGEGPGTSGVFRRKGADWLDDHDSPADVRYPFDVPWVPADDDDYHLPHEGIAPSDPLAVAAMADGLPWVVDHDGSMYRRVPGGWQLMPHEPASDIDIAPDGNVWIVGRDQRRHGFGPWRYYHGTDWDCHDGEAVRISAGYDGLPWIVDGLGRLFRQHVRL
ncbi:hypothetical protein [Nocardioides bruguierae]|uniref:hypothetical protein n=1 Tax=Nocardioides bruguierae TaxID=2945102 RepID=UPI00202186F5|nr:hypothetical protein [Nocardioides bruguierae]MCL8024475.1 hypothetical protein [Nocardioides bruguierae]